MCKQNERYDEYPEFLEVLSQNFSRIVKNENRLYRVDVNTTTLWELFLDSLPTEARQHYTCRTCKHFVERYGNIVTISAAGTIKSTMWSNADVPAFSQGAVTNCNKFVTKKTNKVSGVFLTDTTLLGTPKNYNGSTGEVWHHLHVKVPSTLVTISAVKSVSQLEAEKLEEFKMLQNAINEFDVDTAQKAVTLLSTGELYRGDKVLPQAQWFAEVKELIKPNSVAAKEHNKLWYLVANAPNGFSHVKSSMLGSLLSDVAAGLSTRVIMASFAEKMNPEHYQRSQAAPTAQAIMNAEKLVSDLGIEDSLRRAYATFEEIKDECMWLPRDIKYPKKSSGSATGVFSNVRPKEKVTPTINNLPSSTMTFHKFARTVLPTADKLEVLVNNPSRFMAMVTEAVPNSKKIIRWDNPYSWYYGAGIDGEMKKRVEREGGRYEDNEIRCSLMWNTYTDLDIHCQLVTTYPARHYHISYSQKRAANGYLDVDMNVSDYDSLTPVENIRWQKDAPNGHYKFYVNDFTNRSSKNEYTVELEIAGQVYTTHGDIHYTGANNTVFEFDYIDGQVSNMQFGDNTSSVSSQKWSIATHDFVPVKGIVKSPNTWNGPDASGEHTFFLLEGCKDESEGLGRGFFIEMLVPELKEIRKTLEAYTQSSPIENVENATACGVGFTDQVDWDLTVKVTSKGAERVIKIDRFD